MPSFPGPRRWERQAPEMRAELLAVLQRQSELPNFHDISTDVRSISQDTLWKTFFLAGYGKRSAPQHRPLPGNLGGGAEHTGAEDPRCSR